MNRYAQRVLGAAGAAVVGVLLGSSVEAQRIRPARGATNLQLAVPNGGELRVGEFGAAFLVSEGAQGSRDLNGDGDTDDLVLHVRPTGALRSDNLGIAVPLGNTGPTPGVLTGQFLRFSVSEITQGGIDLNADGDAQDSVLHLYDFVTGQVRNLGLATGVASAGATPPVEWRSSAGWILFAVDEAAQGSTDLNGDGDVLDRILHAHEASTATTRNLRLHAYRLNASRDTVDVVASEFHGGVDLNGDGDLYDAVPQRVDLGTGDVTNLALAISGNPWASPSGARPSVSGDLVILQVPESSQGNTDLNGDGDTADVVLHVGDWRTGRATNLGLAGGCLAGTDGRALLRVSEASQGGTDFNGDGDALDDVLFGADLVAGSATYLGTSFLPSWSVVHGRFAALVVAESDEGDLNGDGDTWDWVLHAIDADAQRLRNVGLAVVAISGSGGQQPTASLRGRHIAFRVDESGQGVDLNADGDLLDDVAFYHDVLSGRTTTEGHAVAVAPTMLSERYGVLLRSEYEAEADLNGDGDFSDRVLHVRDAQAALTHNLGLAAEQPDFTDGASFVVDVSEAEQGNRDLNRDGDALDRVLFAWSPGARAAHNLGHAVGYLGPYYPGQCGGRGCPPEGLYPALGGGSILFAVPELDDGGRDLNRDGDVGDFVLRLVHRKTTVGTPTPPVAAATTARREWGGETRRVSVSSSGGEGNGDSSRSAISADSRFVVFESIASNLVPDDTNSRTDVFVHDHRARSTERISVSSAGVQANDASGGPFGTSASGDIVAFSSLASNLVQGDTNNATDVFVRDRLAGTTERISVSTGGLGGNRKSNQPRVSADGNRVVFASDSTNLVPGDTNGQKDIFLRNRSSGTTVRLSMAWDGSEANGPSAYPVISADGKFVSFFSHATNLTPCCSTGAGEIFVQEIATGVTERIAAGNLVSSLSENGRFVAFDSFAQNLVPGEFNYINDVFVWDRWTSTMERVSVSSRGSEGDGHSALPSISWDGRRVAFESTATNLSPVDSNGSSDIFVHDRESGVTRRVSVSTAGVEGNMDSLWPAISSSGEAVAYHSNADNLVANDTNWSSDAIVTRVADGLVTIR